MKKLNTSPISGMQELLPAEQVVFNKYKRKIEEVYHQHGFLEIETPTIDRAEVLFAKAGGETEKQIYKVIKTEETDDSADQALRFDHTVPLARYVVQHESDLAFPFKVTQIGRNFRGERAQRGRFREFYQCDIDVIGRNNLPIEYDADVILTLFEALNGIGLSGCLVRISNRKILTGLLEALNLNHLSKEILSIIDHAEKVPETATKESLMELGIGEENVVKITTFIGISGKFSDVKEKLCELGIESEKYDEGIFELETTMNILETVSDEEFFIADMKIVRGLDYYTGMVFETILVEHKEIGSICSGGRYENLAGLYTDQILPGVGGSIGLTRLFFIMNEYNLFDRDIEKPVEVVIVPFSKEQYNYCLELAKKIRDEGQNVDVLFSDKKLGDKLTFAAKIAKFGIVIGEDEVKSGEYKVKNFDTGEILSA